MSGIVWSRTQGYRLSLERGQIPTTAEACGLMPQGTQICDLGVYRKLWETEQ